MLRRLLLRRAPPRGAALGRCLSDVSDEAPATRPRSESAAAKVKRSDMGRIAVGIGEGHRMKAGVKTCMGCGVEVVGGLSGLATGSKAMEVTAATKKKKASFSDITDGGKMCSRCSALKKGDVWSAYDALRDVGPEVFKKQLEYIVQRRRFGLCVYVVDAADFEGSVVAGLRNLIKGIPIILAITKTDLLPRISDSDIKYLKHRFEQRCTKVQAVHALAFDPANNTYMNENLVSLGEDVLDILGGRDVFVVGAANVGKSTLVKNLSRLLSEFSLIGKGRNKKSIRRRQEVLVEKDTISNITASHLPGTTLQAIRIPCFGSPKHALWDTPGIIQETSLAYSVFPTHLMEPLARPSKIIIRDKLRALPGESILLEAAWTPVPRVCLARIDVLTIDGDQSTPMEFDPYCPEAIHVRIVKTSEAPEAAIFSEESIDHVRAQLPNKVAKLFKVPEAVKFGKWKTAAPDETSDYSFKKLDICFPSIGWVTCGRRGKFEVEPRTLEKSVWFKRRPLYSMKPEANENDYVNDPRFKAIDGDVIDERLVSAAKEGRHRANQQNLPVKSQRTKEGNDGLERAFKGGGWDDDGDDHSGWGGDGWEYGGHF